MLESKLRTGTSKTKKIQICLASQQSHIINQLYILTKRLLSRWLDIGLILFLFFLTISVLSFVSRCSHLSCRSRRFDCLLLVFFRRWGRLVTQYNLYHAGGLWLVHFNPHCSGEKLFPQWSVVVPFSCCVSSPWACTLGDFQFRYPCWCYQGEVLCE